MGEVEVLLQQLGLGEYEARAYVSLVGRDPLNGYELAKVSGLPRSNVYGILQKLEDRGAVVRMDTASGARYTAVAPAELTRRLGTRFQETLRAAEAALQDMAHPAPEQHVWTVQGYEVLLDHARSVADAARQELLVTVPPGESIRSTTPTTSLSSRTRSICFLANPSSASMIAPLTLIMAIFFGAYRASE